jgi:flagellar FliJ protein
MKRFSFNLETLLELRTREEEKVMLQLAEKNRAILGKKEELSNVYGQLKNLQTSEKTRRETSASVLLLRYSVAYRYKLKAEMLTLGRTIDELQAEAALIRRNLVKATQARKTLEKVKERERTEWKKMAVRKEQKFIDDVAQQRYIADGR